MNKINKIIGTILVTGIILNPTSTFALEKKETVYANLNYNGKVSKTVVNNHLYLQDKGTVEDETELKDILNINGDEKYNLDGNKLTWKSSGKDIFYQGTTDKELPVSVKATYYLNGKKTSVKKMLGKEGSVKIVLSFTNNYYDEKDKIYTPIVTTVGTIISDKENTNIEITNGKRVDTGTKNMLVGIASPGLYESTKLEELKGLDEITITYDTTNFSLNNIYIVATPKLLEESDFNVFNKMDILYKSINTLSESTDKIESGSDELENGTNTILAGTETISANLKKAYDGIEKIANGSVSVDKGLEQVITALTTAKQQLDTTSLDYLKATNITAANTLLESLKAQGLTNDLTSLFNQFTVSSFGLGGTYSDASSANTALQSYLLNSPYAEQTANLMQLKSLYDVYLLLNTDATAFGQTGEKINYLSSQIDILLSGLSELKNGTTELTTGITSLKTGIYSLYTGSITLTEGTKTLSEGTTTLSNGISTLNKEGIKKLTGYTDKFKNYTNTAKKLLEKSNEYNGFTSSNANNTIFIYKMKSAK